MIGLPEIGIILCFLILHYFNSFRIRKLEKKIPAAMEHLSTEGKPSVYNKKQIKEQKE